ncbi:MAG: hypothetical protein K9J27_09775 [Bacteroidales bacterium]|nr:hypothetical protein [Bacteroidales bacterium]MCF8334819.1 hypothetical protein [Bacteroidales bacterium]
MAIITLKIKDSKLSFFKELVRNLDFAKVEKVEQGDMEEDEEEDEYRDPTKEEIKENIRQGLREVKMIEEGKMKPIPLKDLLDEV